jgi:hypothetical protein
LTSQLVTWLPYQKSLKWSHLLRQVVWRWVLTSWPRSIITMPLIPSHESIQFLSLEKLTFTHKLKISQNK